MLNSVPITSKRQVRLWKLKAASLSERGANRDGNEDCVLCEKAAGIFAAADGLGGYEGGAEASELLCVVIAGELMETQTDADFGVGDARAAFENAVAKAIDGMKGLAGMVPAMSSMGSTIVVGWIVDDYLYYAHAGDSRLYLLRHKRLERLTSDDSFVESLCRKEVVREFARRSNTSRRYLTRYVGPKSKDIRLHVDRIRIWPGDRLILTTDGITKALDDEAIRRAANVTRTPAELCRWLSIAAKESNARDDMSCVAVDFKKAPPNSSRGVH